MYVKLLARVHKYKSISISIITKCAILIMIIDISLSSPSTKLFYIQVTMIDTSEVLNKQAYILFYNKVSNSLKTLNTYLIAWHVLQTLPIKGDSSTPTGASPTTANIKTQNLCIINMVYQQDMVFTRAGNRLRFWNRLSLTSSQLIID